MTLLVRPFCLAKPTESSSCRCAALVHLADERVNLLLSVAVVAALGVRDSLLLVATSGRRKLERPQERRGILEVRADREDLVDKVLAHDRESAPV